MTVRSLLIVGAGGFARETAEAVRAVNARHPEWELLGFLDDDHRLQGRRVADVPVLGPVDAIERYPSACAIVCVGNPHDYFARKRIVDRLGLDQERWATIVHPSAELSGSTQLGFGSVVLAGSVATVAVRIGAHVSVMPGSIFTHDDVIRDFATFGSGVRLGGGVSVGEGAYVGAGALVRERVSIGPWALVGMGAVVTRDVPGGEVWAGVPARHLRPVSIPPEPARKPDPQTRPVGGPR